MGFSRQEYWNGLPFPSPGDLPDPGIEPRCPALQTDFLPTELRGEAPGGAANSRVWAEKALSTGPAQRQDTLHILTLC